MGQVEADLHAAGPVAHFLAEQKVVETRRADVIEGLLEDLVDDILVDSVDGHHLQILVEEMHESVEGF